jgi:hypothetical protein
MLGRKIPNTIICLLIDSNATATRGWHVSPQTLKALNHLSEKRMMAGHLAGLEQSTQLTP